MRRRALKPKPEYVARRNLLLDLSGIPTHGTLTDLVNRRRAGRHAPPVTRGAVSNAIRGDLVSEPLLDDIAAVVAEAFTVLGQPARAAEVPAAFTRPSPTA